MGVQQWETYYQGGAIATCPTAPDGGYDREVRDAWVGFFGTLPGGASLLDVGCGNGVVALIAKETAAALDVEWDIHGTDLARTDPRQLVKDGVHRLAGITFHPGVPTERLPFDDGRFHAVSGHYALEYTDIEAALGEIHRVLRSGSRAQFVLHHADSVLVQAARVSLREADLVFNETKLYKRTQRLVAMEQVVPQTTKNVSEELREAIRTTRQAHEIVQQVGGGRILAVALDAVQKLLALRKQVNAQAAALEVDRAERELRDAVKRLRDLVQHALSAEDMARIQRQAVAVGFQDVEISLLHHGGSNLVGWQLVMTRA